MSTNRFSSIQLHDILREGNFPIDKHDKIIALCNSNGTLLSKNGGQEYEFPAADFHGSQRHIF